ncbi:MAG: hypothetical protein LIO65_05815, partial [Odoribacter sp.]|nr:hypothetical protein [Odoribacter sp.]
MKNIIKYFREISVVVIGIAITFLVSDWISQRNEKKTVNRYLAAVMIELEDNRNLVREKQLFYKKTHDLAMYLLRDKPENHHPDSIWQL